MSDVLRVVIIMLWIASVYCLWATGTIESGPEMVTDVEITHYGFFDEYAYMTIAPDARGGSTVHWSSLLAYIAATFLTGWLVTLAVKRPAHV